MNASPGQAVVLEKLEDRLLLAAAPVRTVQFAGLDWVVKSAADQLSGPGNNAYDSSANAVWTDAEGLHLRLRHVGAQWYSAGVYSAKATPHGLHKFFLNTRLEFDQNVIFGLSVAAPDEQKMGVYFSYDPNLGVNSYFVAGPLSVAGTVVPFLTSVNKPTTTHYFDWQKSSIHFKSYYGHGPKPNVLAGELIRDWTYVGPLVPKQDEALRIEMNLWVNTGGATFSGKEFHVVIQDGQFPQPLTTVPKRVAFNSVVPSGSRRLATGVVSGVKFSNYEIALYVKVGSQYKLQPPASTGAPIAGNGLWQVKNVPSGKLYVFLVRKTYNPPKTTAQPLNVDGLNVLAMDTWG